MFSLFNQFPEEMASICLHWNMSLNKLNVAFVPPLNPEGTLGTLVFIIEFLDENDLWLSPFAAFRILCLLLQFIFAHFFEI